MSPRRPATLFLLSTLALFAGCSSAPTRNDTVAGPVAASRAPNAIEYGTVSAIEPMSGASRTTGGGAVLGAVIGAVVGNQIGSGTGRAAATGVGAVGGALIGNTVEKRRQDGDDFYRVRVRLDHGGSGEFDYRNIGDLRVGDRVRIEGGQLARY